jgi:hypothetical protein
MYTTQVKASLLRWLGRILAVFMLLFWGVFFVEHLWEWFMKPLPETPPAKVWLGQLLHLALLVSYLLAMKWDMLGGCFILCTAALFFTSIGITLTVNIAIYLALTVLPGILLLIAWWLDHGQKLAGPSR